MPRRPRCHIAGVPAHVVQRGNNRQPCFFSPDDYDTYREILADALLRHRAKLHAYVLMTNHVHLLITPESPDAISRVMQHTGRHYVSHINSTYRRTGTLWEGRHKASIIDAERYLLACHRYIELNPVRAGMVSGPEEYAWSSHRHYALGITDNLITPHELHRQLNASASARQTAWRELVAEGMAPSMLDEIRQASEKNYPLGGNRFRVQIEKELCRSIGHAERGRPRGCALVRPDNLELF